MRFTKIVCTLGPTSNTEEQIEALARAGMDVARLNMSHGTWEGHRENMHKVQKISKKLMEDPKHRRPIAVLLDTQGPEIRTIPVETPIAIKENEEVVFTAVPLKNEKRTVVTVNHGGFAKDAKQTEVIILDNGKIIFDILSIEKDGRVVAKARESGSIGSRRHVNLPGADLSMPSLTENDWANIAAGAKEEADFVALSFIRRASEVTEVRDFLRQKGLEMRLITKFETKLSVENMDAIIEASDGVMVARGDLGAELPFERIPVIQDRLVSLCRDAGKPVIVATHMLESMIENPTPTRAEVTDIAHAAMTGTDSTMLSGETASGKFPMNSIDAMVRVLQETEHHRSLLQPMQEAIIRGPRDARAEAAVKLALSTKAAAIIVMTKSGKTADEVSRFRPAMPVLAFTPNERAQRWLSLTYGVLPLHIPFEDDPEGSVAHAFELAKNTGLVKKGQQCVLVSDARAGAQNVGTVQIRQIA